MFPTSDISFFLVSSLQTCHSLINRRVYPGRVLSFFLQVITMSDTCGCRQGVIWLALKKITIKTIAYTVEYSLLRKVFARLRYWHRKQLSDRIAQVTLWKTKRSFKIDKTLPWVTQYGIFMFTLSNCNCAAPQIEEDRSPNVYQSPFCNARSDFKKKTLSCFLANKRKPLGSSRSTNTNAHHQVVRGGQVTLHVSTTLKQAVKKAQTLCFKLLSQHQGSLFKT